MGFRTGLLIGVAAGYVLGAKAGRERYEQIKGWLDSLARREPLASLTEKGKSLTGHLPFAPERPGES